MSLVINFIVSGYFLGYEASSQLDNLKLRASKASQKLHTVYFGSHPDRVKYGGLFESCYLSYSLRLLSRS